MAQYFEIHPDNPQARLIKKACEILQNNGVIVYPTDSTYALACSLGNKQGLDRIRKIRQLTDNHNLTLVCRDLSEITKYARLDNSHFRSLKSHTPGPYTFILKATREVPRRLQHPKRKTIGLRIPEHPIALALLESMNEPIMSTSLILPHENLPMIDAHDIREQLEHQVDLVIDGGACGVQATSVIDMTQEVPQILREAKGDVSVF